jgi:hypothetical protein
MNSALKTLILPFVAASMAWLACPADAQPFLVENGQARAEIVIADKPLRTVRLAAQELQDGIQKISGARLPIIMQPTGKAVKIFVGASAHSPSAMSQRECPSTSRASSKTLRTNSTPSVRRMLGRGLRSGFDFMPSHRP